MQRRRNTKYRKYVRLYKVNLHSIPKLLTIITNSKTKLKNNDNKNVKSNVLYSIPSVVSLPLLFGLFCIISIASLLYNLTIGTSVCSALTSTSLTIDGGSSKTITETIVPNETKYVSSNVTYSATDTTNYTINISYAEGSTGLKLEGGSTTIPDVTNTNTSDSSSGGDSTNTGVLGSSISNAWGYTWTPTTTAESSYNTLYYKGIPAYNSNDTSGIIETGTTINPTTKKLIFAANLSDTNPTGHYKAQVVLSIVATPKATTYTLTLDNNDNTGTKTTKTCSTYTTSCDISLNDVAIPAQTGYEFMGWSDYRGATVMYTQADVVTMAANKTIYVVWQMPIGIWFLPNGSKVNSGITYMQNIVTGSGAGSFCSNNIPSGSIITLKDNRTYPSVKITDKNNVTSSTTQQVSNEYIITKMPDGKCWMTQNLRLTGTDSNIVPIISASSNGSSTDTYIMPRNDKNISVSSNNTDEMSFLGTDNAGTVTGYYTWCTATAGSCPLYGNASYSICPKNWKLPTGGRNYIAGNTSDFYSLIIDGAFGNSSSKNSYVASLQSSNSFADSMAVSTLQNSPYDFAFTGRVFNGKFFSTNIYGNWWSSTTNDGSNAYYLNLNSNIVYPGTNLGTRSLGCAVRCIAQ